MEVYGFRLDFSMLYVHIRGGGAKKRKCINDGGEIVMESRKEEKSPFVSLESRQTRTRVYYVNFFIFYINSQAM